METLNTQFPCPNWTVEDGKPDRVWYCQQPSGLGHEGTCCGRRTPQEYNALLQQAYSVQKLSAAQRRVILTDGCLLVGFDTKQRPVVRMQVGIPRQWRRWALKRDGDPIDESGYVTPYQEQT